MIKITKYTDCDEIAYISFFKNTIDLRDWYIIKHDDGWSESWYDNREMNEIKKDDPNVIYKKLPKIKTMFKFHWKVISSIKTLLILLGGIVIGMLIK